MPAVAGVAAAAPTIRVEDPWVRWLPAGLPAGGYATLTNTGEKSVSLVAASSPVWGEISVHRSVNRGVTVDMVAIEHITIAPHSSLDFAATGFHLMLIKPTKPLAPGDFAPITLHFADGSSLTAQFEVRK